MEAIDKKLNKLARKVAPTKNKKQKINRPTFGFNRNQQHTEVKRYDPKDMEKLVKAGAPYAKDPANQNKRWYKIYNVCLKKLETLNSAAENAA